MFWRNRDPNPMVPSLVLPPQQFTTTSNVRTWLKRFDLFVNSNGIINNKREVLLSYLDDETLNILENSRQNEALSYEECTERLIELFEDRAEPKPVSRERFYKRVQDPNEKIIQFASCLSELGRKAYHDLPPESIDIILKDQFIYGLANQTIQDRVLSQQPNTFDEAIDLAKMFENLRTNQTRLNIPQTGFPKKSQNAQETQATIDPQDIINQQESRIARLEEILNNGRGNPPRNTFYNQQLNTPLPNNTVQPNTPNSTPRSRLNFNTPQPPANNYRLPFLRYNNPTPVPPPSMTNNFSNIICHGCKQRGHIRRDCPNLSFIDSGVGWKTPVQNSTLIQGPSNGIMNNPINHGETQQGNLNNSGINQSQMNHANINQVQGPVCQHIEGVLCDDNGKFVQATNPGNANEDHERASASFNSNLEILIDGLINQEPVSFLIDTGANVTIVRKDVWDRSGGHQLEFEAKSNVKSAGGNELKYMELAWLILKWEKFAYITKF